MKKVFKAYDQFDELAEVCLDNTITCAITEDGRLFIFQDKDHAVFCLNVSKESIDKKVYITYRHQTQDYELEWEENEALLAIGAWFNIIDYILENKIAA